MTEFDSKNSINSQANEQRLLALSSNEALFREWLKKANCKNYSPTRIIGLLSEANRRLLKRNLTDKSIWEIDFPDEFFAVHSKALNDKFFALLLDIKICRYFGWVANYIFCF